MMQFLKFLVRSILTLISGSFLLVLWDASSLRKSPWRGLPPEVARDVGGPINGLIAVGILGLMWYLSGRIIRCPKKRERKPMREAKTEHCDTALKRRSRQKPNSS